MTWSRLHWINSLNQFNEVHPGIYLNCTEGAHMYDGHFLVAFPPIMCARSSIILFHLI